MWRYIPFISRMMTTECDIFQCKEMCERFFFLMLKHKYEGHDSHVKRVSGNTTWVS